MSYPSLKANLAVLAALGFALASASASLAQQPAPPGNVKFQVRGASERLEMTVNTSRVVEFPFDVPRMLVNNPELVRVVPISPRSIQLSAVKAGVTQLNVWDTADNVTSLDLIILGDVGELDLTLKSLFPEASVKLRPLNSSLYISGFVPKPDMVGSIIRVAQDYFPNIINDMTVGGVHKILLHVKVMEVSRTKLRALGFDWDLVTSGGFVTQSVSQLVPGVFPINADAFPTVRFGITNGEDFRGFLQALRQYDLAKLLSEPTLTTLDGRPASFNVGGQIPIPIQQSLGVTTIQWREFGTRIDFVPIVLGNGVLRLEVRPDISQVDSSLRDSVTGTVGFRSRRADTAVEMKAGQTLAIAGLIESRVETTNRGIPILADLPWLGVPFRRVQERANEIETLIFVTPEFCEAMDPNEVPPCGPGQLTTSPTDCELYFKGYMEVPKQCAPGYGGHGGPGLIGPGFEEVPKGPSNGTPPGVPVPVPPLGAEANAGGTSRRTNAIGTGATPRPGSSGRISDSYYSGGGTPTPAPVVQPAMIGPAGYDELR
jgi:pilus assembly protein CpaC